MSDSKKPTVSVIRAREQAASKGLYETTICDGSGEIIKQSDIPCLLDLVKRMGKALEQYGDHEMGCSVVEDENCDCGWEEARELLKEIEK